MTYEGMDVKYLYNRLIWEESKYDGHTDGVAVINDVADHGPVSNDLAGDEDIRDSDFRLLE